MTGLKKWFLVMVIIAVVGIILYPQLFPSSTGDQEPAAGSSLAPSTMVREALGKDKIVAVAFSYDAECCPGTQEFFAAYKESVFNVLDEYQEEAQLVWLNAGTPHIEDQEEMMGLAEQYGVEYLPSLLLLNPTGETIEIIVGPLNEQLLRELLRGEGR